MNYITTDNINFKLKDAHKFVTESEKLYNDRLIDAADRIYNDRNEKPVLLLSGPSGAGKTTTAFRLAKLLEERGVSVHTVSMDNYFLPNDHKSLPVDENGKLDLESPHRLDIPLFKNHLEKLIKCESVPIPMFHFLTQSRTVKETIQRRRNEIIIFEGIHALNPLVTGSAHDSTNFIYLSVRTRIKGSSGAELHPQTIRLMRRLNRDRLFRGRKVEDVFAMLPSVCRGEEKHILPFKDRADISIDTFIGYEASVYKSILIPELESAHSKLSGNNEYEALIDIMHEIDVLDQKYVPCNSLIREFVGGSSFKY